MSKGQKPIPVDIGNYLQYDETTGDLTWIKKTSKYSNVPIGNIAGVHMPDGHIRTAFKNNSYYNHRIAWFLKTGSQPPDEIDHFDENGSNNRWNNLRDSKNQNQHNRGKYTSNTSGYKGVHWHKQHNKWNAKIMCKGETYHLGYFDTPELAYEAYCTAADKYHKEFSNYG